MGTKAKQQTAVSVLLLAASMCLLLFSQQVAAQAPNSSSDFTTPPSQPLLPSGTPPGGSSSSVPTDPSSNADTTPLSPGSTPGAPIQQQGGADQSTPPNSSSSSSSSPNTPPQGGSSATSSSPPSARTSGLEAAADPKDSKTSDTVKQVTQQQANNVTLPVAMAPDNSSSSTNDPNSPQVQVAQGDMQSLVNLASVPGCGDPAGTAFLTPGLDNTCGIEGVLGRREVEAFAFSLQAATNKTRPYRVIILLRTVDGEAQLGLSAPVAGRGTDLMPNVVGTSIYSTEVTSQQYIEVPWEFIRQSGGGRFVITLSRARTRLVYTLKVSTPYADMRLDDADVAAMKDLQAACCKDTEEDSPFCSRVLPAALASNHTDDEDLCQIAPILCNSQGRMTQLTLANAGLSCPNGLPASLSGLAALNTLDLAFNKLNSTMDRVAQVVSTLPALENLFMRYTDLRGRLNCSMLGAATKIQRLSFSGNGDIVGELPSCFFQSPTLQELYLSQTGLSGQLPDTLPRNSSLKVLFAIGLTDQQRPDPTNAGFMGPLPRSLLASQSLTYVDLSNNELSGALPSLPPTIRLLNLSANALDGDFPGALPPTLEILDVSMNKMTGSLPSDLSSLAALSLLDVSVNNMTGNMPTVLAPNLLVLDVSLNRIGGSIPSPLPASMTYLGATQTGIAGNLPQVPVGSALRQVLLGGNNLEGSIPVSLINGSAFDLRFLDLSNNKLTGPVDPTVPTTAEPPAQPAAAASPSGRRMLLQQPSQISPQQQNLTTQQRQQQQQQGGVSDSPPASNASGGAEDVQRTGPWQSLLLLSYVDLSRNELTGPVPPSLARAPSLMYLSLAFNALSGSLKPFADALAANAAASSLLVLDVSNNKLTGAVPAGLAAAPMLDPNTRAVGRQGRPVPRMLNMSDNALSGPFPAFLITQPPLVEASCQGCMVRVGVNGSAMNLQCPSELDVTPQQLPFLNRSSYQCTNSAGQKVSLLTAATSVPTGAPASSAVDPSVGDPNGPFYSSMLAARSPPPPPSGSSSGLNGGQIAGIVIGSIAGALLLGSLAAAGAIRYRRHRAGWRKDDLNDLNVTSGGQLDGAFGVNPLPTSAGAQSNAAAAAEAGMGHTITPIHVPRSPYSMRYTGNSAGAIEMQNSAGRPANI